MVNSLCRSRARPSTSKPGPRLALVAGTRIVISDFGFWILDCFSIGIDNGAFLWYGKISLRKLSLLQGIEMKELTSSVSPKGQITLPIEIRKLLNIKPKDKVAFTVDQEGVRIMPVKSRLAAGFG